MRVLLIPALALAFAATPALAQHAPEAVVADLANDPGVQRHVEDRVSDAVDAVLDMRIGSLERAANPWSRARRDDTLGDRLERDDPYLRDRIDRNTRRGTRMMGAMASEFAALMPELRASMGRLSRRIDDIRARGYDDAPPPPRYPRDAGPDDEGDFGWDE